MLQSKMIKLWRFVIQYFFTKIQTKLIVMYKKKLKKNPQLKIVEDFKERR